jgi:hypothetical protein
VFFFNGEISDASDEEPPLQQPYAIFYQVHPKIGGKKLLPCRGIHGIAVEIVGSAEDIERFTRPVHMNLSKIIKRTRVVPKIFHSCGPSSVPLLIWTHSWPVNISNGIYPACNIELVEHYLRSLIRRRIYHSKNEIPGTGVQEQLYKRVDSWTDIISWNSFKCLFETDSTMHINGVDDNIEKLLRVHQDYVYSVWKAGEVPMEIVKIYHLENRLSVVDWEEYNEWLMKRRIQNREVLELG